MFNYSSPSVKNSALLALASIPHKLAGSLIFGIWCRAVLLFLPSSVGLLALPRSRVIHTGVHTHVYSHNDAPCLSVLWDNLPHCAVGDLPTTSLQQVSRFSAKVQRQRFLPGDFNMHSIRGSAKLHNCSHSIALQTEAENARLLRSPNCAFQ